MVEKESRFSLIRPFKPISILRLLNRGDDQGPIPVEIEISEHNQSTKHRQSQNNAMVEVPPGCVVPRGERCELRLKKTRLNAPERPHLRALYDQWLQWAGVAEMPRRCDIDPLDIPQTLGRLTIARSAPCAKKWTYSLFGTELARVLREDLTSRPFDAFHLTPMGQDLHQVYAEVSRTGRPCFEEITLATEHASLTFERAVLPVSEADPTPPALLTGYDDSQPGECGSGLQRQLWDRLFLSCRQL